MKGLHDPGENEERLAETNVRPRFWQRQFSDNVTTPQLVFDIALGIVMPILCFFFDPIVFNNSFGDTPFAPDLYQYKLFVYVFSALAVITLSVWLILGNRSALMSSVIAGILLSGSVLCLLIGILILPLSLLGLMLLIGVLGFTPFFTSFVYLRNSVRALNAAKVYLRQPRLSASLLLGACLVIGPAFLMHWQINLMITQAVNDVMSGDSQRVVSAGERLRYFTWAIDSDQIVWSYHRERDPTRKDALAKAYNAITGRDIQKRLTLLLD